MIKTDLLKRISLMFLIFIATFLVTISSSYALFSYSTSSGSSMFISYAKVKSNLRKDFTSLYNYTEGENTYNYLSNYTAILTSNVLRLPDTYTYNGTLCTVEGYKDVSEQGNGQVRLYTYNCGYSKIGIISQSGHVVAPADSSYLFNVDGTNTSSNINNISEIDLTYLDTSNVTDMSWMFGYCYNLTKLNISNFDTSNVTTMETMFAFCDKITTIDVSSFDTSKVTNMHSVFAYCKNLTSIDVTKFDTSKVTNMRGMFAYCSSLTSINVSNFNTSNVTTMQTMFAGCSKITSLDLRNFNTLKVTSMTTMFFGSSKLTSIIVGCNWQTAATATNMFASAGTDDVTKICDEKANLRKDFVSLYDYTSGDTTYNYLANYTAILTSNNLNMPSTYTYNGVSYTKVEYKDVSEQGNDLVRLYTYKSGSTQIGVLAQAGGVIAPADSSNLFYIDYNNNTNNIKEIDLTYLDTSNVTNMSRMFVWCVNLTKLNVKSFNTSKVTNMSAMFARCYKLTSLDVTSFDTSNVTNMQIMFYFCTVLTSINLSSFKTPKLTSMYAMFSQCKALTAVDFSTFDTNKVTTMHSLFDCCEKLASVKFSTTTNGLSLTTMAGMFGGCKSLTSLDLTSFNTSNVTVMDGLFAITPNLKSVKVGCNWKMASNVAGMFHDSGISSVTQVC